MNFEVPKREKLWVVFSDGENATHIITSTWPLRDKYFLYQVSVNGELKKLGSNANPKALEAKYLKTESDEPEEE